MTGPGALMASGQLHADRGPLPPVLAAIPFPEIDPEIVRIGHFAIRWYALAYIAGIILGWRLAARALRTPRLWHDESPPMTPAQLEELLTWLIVGILLGGRLGFVLFYQPAYYVTHPLQIPAIWQGGMSFHGGALGVLLAAYFYCRRHGLPFAGAADLIALAAPAGLFLGRIANFINAELWGRPTEVPWAVVFPGERAQDCPGVPGLCARHPSQLYEAGLEGLLLGGLVVFLAWQRGWLKMPGQILGVFLTGYGMARTFVEFFRQADPQYITPANPWGHVLRMGDFGVTMGQLLSIPMVLAGFLIIWLAQRRARG